MFVGHALLIDLMSLTLFVVVLDVLTGRKGRFHGYGIASSTLLAGVVHTSDIKRKNVRLAVLKSMEDKDQLESNRTWSDDDPRFTYLHRILSKNVVLRPK